MALSTATKATIGGVAVTAALALAAYLSTGNIGTAVNIAISKEAQKQECEQLLAADPVTANTTPAAAVAPVTTPTSTPAQ